MTTPTPRTPCAHDMGRYHRLVNVEGDRVRGTFAVLLSVNRGEMWVGTHDVTVYDSPERRSGRVLYSSDLKGSVTDGVADLKEHMIASRVVDDVLDVMDEMKAAMAAAAEAASPGEPSSPPAEDEVGVAYMLGYSAAKDEPALDTRADVTEQAAVPAPDRDTIAKIIAQAALDWDDIETDGHEHDLDCTNWTAYLEDADAVLALLRGGESQ